MTPCPPPHETLNGKNNGFDLFTTRDFINTKTSILRFDFLLWLILCGGSVFVLENMFL